MLILNSHLKFQERPVSEKVESVKKSKKSASSDTLTYPPLPKKTISLKLMMKNLNVQLSTKI